MKQLELLTTNPVKKSVTVPYAVSIHTCTKPFSLTFVAACNTPLSMERNIIKDKEITGSSYLEKSKKTEPRHARLKQSGGWCVAKMKHFNSYYGLNDSLGKHNA